MKKTLILSGIIALFGAALLVSCNQGGASKGEAEALPDSLQVASAPITASDIAYFNVDLVLLGYDKAADLNAEFENKAQKISSELERKSKQIQNDYQKLMENYQKGLILQSSAEKQGQDIQARQEKFNQEYAKKQDELAQENQVMVNNLMNDIAEFVKQYNEVRGYRLILANQTGLLSSPVVLADEAMDITQEIIDGLNAAYLESK